jgi:hypothetical protein
MPDNANAGASAPAAAPVVIPVRAKSIGWIGLRRVQPDTEFTVPNEDALGLWMERLDGGPSKAELNKRKAKAAEAEDRAMQNTIVAAVKASRTR